MEKQIKFYPVDKLPNYAINKRGDVIEISTGKQIKVYCNSGYMAVTLKKYNRRKKYLVHRLLAIAFIPNPENKPFVNHIDGHKANNKLNNLEWVTHLENDSHARKTGLFNKKVANVEHALPENRELVEKLNTLRQKLPFGWAVTISKKAKVSERTVYNVFNGFSNNQSVIGAAMQLAKETEELEAKINTLLGYFPTTTNPEA